MSPAPLTKRQCLFTSLQLVLLILVLLSGLTGCSSHTARTQELMATNYQQLDNDTLLLHYYEIEDQISVTEQRRSSPTVSLGFGLGSFGGRSSVGAGVGVSTPVGQPETAADLRAHRNRVRLELQKRGITP